MSIEFKTITGQQQPYLNNSSQDELQITTVITLLEILDVGLDAQS